jgi:hypothetical protein
MLYIVNDEAVFSMGIVAGLVGRQGDDEAEAVVVGYLDTAVMQSHISLTNQ